MRTLAEWSRETIAVSYGSRFTAKISSHCTTIFATQIYSKTKVHNIPTILYALSATKQKQNAPKRFDRESDEQKTSSDDQTDNNTTVTHSSPRVHNEFYSG